MARLDADRLLGLEKQDFEEFCRALLDREYEQCFEPRSVDIDGPAEQDWADGGRDLEANILEPPHTSNHFGLLPLEVGRAWFSCKTHGPRSTRRGGWKTAVLGDIAKKNSTSATRLLEVLADGGSFCVLVNVRGDHIHEFETTLAKRLAQRIVDELGRTVDLTRQIRVHDATHLANVFNARPFVLPERLQAALQIREPTFFVAWSRWTEKMTQQRPLLDFVPDPSREDLIEGVRRFVSSEDAPRSPVWRLAGAPGTGKTRLVHHALDQAGVRERVRYSTNFRSAMSWIDQEGLGQLPDVILVMDEVGPSEAEALARTFTPSRSGSAARLVLIGPRDDADLGEPRPQLLEPLEDDALSTIVDREIEEAGGTADPKRVMGLVVSLSRGFPLFAMWLTRALAKDPGLLNDPGSRLTGGDDPWRATAAVLAGAPSEFGGEHAWLHEAELRAASLLVVIMQPDDPRGLVPDERDALASVLSGATWRELKKAMDACQDRGLLRHEPPGHHYISPANLERLVLNHLFRGPRGLDPEPIRRALGPGYERLLRRAHVVSASDACRERLAGAVLDQLPTLDPEAWTETWPVLSVLSWAAFSDPPRAAVALAALVSHAGASRIAGDPRLLERVREVLAHLCRRRLSLDAFEAVERALFALARHDAWRGRDSTRAVWSQLFQAAGDQTHQPFDARASILRRRLHEPPTEARVLALEGLERLCEERTGPAVYGWNGVDAPWIEATSKDIAVHQRLGWTWLVELTDDPQPEVSAAARDVLTRSLARGPEGTLPRSILEALPEHARSWTMQERNALRVAVEGLVEKRDRMPERPWWQMRGPALDRLRHALAPVDVHDRLLSRVGRRHPDTLDLPTASRQEQERDADRALAAEIVSDPGLLREHVGWLASEAAVRASALGRALGFVDDARVVLPVLMEGRARHPIAPVIVAYLAGWSAREEDARAIDAWLREHAEDRSCATLVAACIVAVGGTDPRAALLVALVERGGLTHRSLLGLGFHAWHEGVSRPRLDALVLALSRGPERFYWTEALGLCTRRITRDDRDVSSELRACIHRLLRTTSVDEISAVAERDWVDLALRWRPRDERVVATVLGTLVEKEGRYLAHARQVLRQWIAADPSSVWATVVQDFAGLEGGPASVLGHVLGELDLVATLPPPEVLAWIGVDLDRAVQVASWIGFHGDDLPGVVEGLLRRFGADGEVASWLYAAALECPLALRPEEHDARQAERIERWRAASPDPSPEMSRWVSRLEAALAARTRSRPEAG